MASRSLALCRRYRGMLRPAVASAQAAGALAVGACGAYGFAYDYRAGAGARAGRARQMRGRLQGRAGARAPAAPSRSTAAMPAARMAMRSAPRLGRGAERGAAAVLQVRRQGLRDPRLGLRRQRLIARRPVRLTSIACISRCRQLSHRASVEPIAHLTQLTALATDAVWHI